MMKTLLRTTLVIAGLVSLSACSWETYTKKDGSRGLHQTTPIGSGVYYADGTSSKNQRYNQHRPVRHVVPRENAGQEQDVRGTHWEAPQFK
jgi:hypothetical protein